MALRGRYQTLLLLAGLLTGGLLAAVGATGGAGTARVADSVARVGERDISRAEFDAILQALAAEQTDQTAAQHRRRVLQKLIDEELLVQYGLDVGLGTRDRQVRSAVVAAVMATRRAEAELRPLDDEQLRAFYHENQRRFTPPPTLRVRALRMPAAIAEARLGDLRALPPEDPRWDRLAGAEDSRPLPVPNTLLPADKLANYIGADAAEAAARLPGPGALVLVDGPQHAIVLQLLERHDVPTPPFTRIRDSVERELRRWLAEQSLDLLLNDLRRQTVVEIYPAANAR